MSDPIPGTPREPTAELQLAVACLLVAAGGLLLGLQVDGLGHFVGTGWTPLGIGAIVAVVASIVQGARAGRVPRDPVSTLSALCGFCGVAFVVAGVIAPGGGWMFFEVALLLWLSTRRRSDSLTAGVELTPGTLWVLAAMLLFRLWVTYQGSLHRWELISVPIPGLASIPLDFLAPIQSVELGSFRPEELGFPPTGLDFPLTTFLWSTGFALCAAGMWWRIRAGQEHESDRIHATIHTLPTHLALLVEKLLPEERWEELGLFGLSARLRAKRIEALVRERLGERAEFDAALHAVRTRTASMTPEDTARIDLGGFEGEIASLLLEEAPPRPPQLRPQLPPHGGTG